MSDNIEIDIMEGLFESTKENDVHRREFFMFFDRMLDNMFAEDYSNEST